ncbi:hypothetical protein BGZ94_010371 [Podila epigama]|nr:hypothetical protein BGZ94_010371 [Podila epigama]
MLQIRPPVFMPATAEQVLHTLNIVLFMSDFNTEPRPLAFNVLACSSTGLIHYIQIANQHLSLIVPTYNITHSGRKPELIPALLKTFLESTAYTKVGFGAYEDAMRIKDQYGISCKNIRDTHWMAKVLGVGSTNVGMLYNVFGDPHDMFVPGNITQLQQQQQQQSKSSTSSSSSSSSSTHNTGMNNESLSIDPRRWDWESHGNLDLDRELVRCIAQDAFATLNMYDNIHTKTFRYGYKPPWENSQHAASLAKDFLFTNLPRGTGPFLSSENNPIERDAQALALVKILIDQKDLIADKADTSPFTFQDPSTLSRLVALPGIRSSEAILEHTATKRMVASLFGCRADELRLLHDSDMARKPDKIQDLECFLGVYEWLEFLPDVHDDDDAVDRVGSLGSKVITTSRTTSTTSRSSGGRKESALLALFLNFGTIATRAKEQPAATRQWAIQRIERLVQQGVLLREQGLIRVEPRLLRQLKRIETKEDSIVRENKVLLAN